MRLVVRAVLLAGAVIAGSAAPALAAEAPQTALPALTKLSSDITDFNDSTSVAINAAGEGVVAWVERPAWPSRSGMFVSYRSAAGAWSAPERISSADKDAASAHAAIDPAGTATIAWTETLDYYAQVVHVAKHSAAGYTDHQSFTPPTGGATQLDLDVAPTGDAVLAWNAVTFCDLCGSRNPGVIWAATRAGGGAFGTPQQLSDPDKTYRGALSAAIGARGDIAVGWEEGPVNDYHVRARIRPAGGTFSATADVPAPDVATAVPNLVVGPTGVTTIVWWQARAMHATRAGLDGSTSPQQTLPGVYTGGFAQGRAALEVDGAGRVTAAWVTNDGLWTATGADGADLGSAAMLDRYATADGRSPSLAVDAAAGTLVTWISDRAVRAGWRPAAGPAFRATGTIGAGAVGSEPRVALAGGRALLTGWFGDGSGKVSLFGTIGDPAAIAPPLAAPGSDMTTPDTAAPVLKVTSAKVIKTKVKGKRKRAQQLHIVVRASEAADVVATVTRKAAGVRKGRTCVAKPKRSSHRRKARACTRTVTVGKAFSASLATGTTTLMLGAAPPRGTYRVTVTGADAAGNDAKPSTRRFKVR